MTAWLVFLACSSVLVSLIACVWVDFGDWYDGETQ